MLYVYHYNTTMLFWDSCNCWTWTRTSTVWGRIATQMSSHFDHKTPLMLHPLMFNFLWLPLTYLSHFTWPTELQPVSYIHTETQFLVLVSRLSIRDVSMLFWMSGDGSSYLWDCRQYWRSRPRHGEGRCWCGKMPQSITHRYKIFEVHKAKSE